MYFAFGGDEEVNGHGAKDVIAELRRRGVKPGMVLDEGGAVVDGVFPGVKEPIAVVGIGEKGMMNVRLRAESAGGHASHPERPSALGMVCRAAADCESHPFPAHLTKPAREMLATLAPHTPFGLRVVLANLWCFGPVLCAAAEKLGSELNAMLRTTAAFTMARGSKQINVLPAEAEVGVNLRLLNTETPDEAAAYLRRVIKNDRVTVDVEYAEPASPYASTDTEPLGQTGLGRRGHVEGLPCLAVLNDRLFRQPPLRGLLRRRVQVQRHAPDGRAARADPQPQRAHPGERDREDGGIFHAL